VSLVHGSQRLTHATSSPGLPKEQHHNWKYIAFGPDNKLYVPFGAPCNICVPGEEYAQIRRCATCRR